jgi:hypothetical protein
MNCPTQIAHVILEILHRGLIRTRSFGFSGEAKKCASEADHLHNLPHVLADYRWERLRYYWEVERPCFMERVPLHERHGYFFEESWQQLEELVEQERPIHRANQSG